jgi:predicted  nucleic acid-binding Zn-ribbon protein
MTEDQLLQIKEQIDTAKSEISKLEGRKENLMETLNSQFKCKSVEEAEKTLLSLTTQIKEIDLTIQEESKKLESKYDFDA